jgi:hypothetical protein
MLRPGAGLVFAAAFLFTPIAFAQQARDLSGAWRGQESPTDAEGLHAEYPPHFVATLTQVDGRKFAGEGTSNPCTICRADNQYDVRWRGIVDGDRVVLIMAYGNTYRGDMRFEGRIDANGQCITGVASDGRDSTPFIMWRARGNGAAEIACGDDASPGNAPQ